MRILFVLLLLCSAAPLFALPVREFENSTRTFKHKDGQGYDTIVEKEKWISYYRYAKNGITDEDADDIIRLYLKDLIEEHHADWLDPKWDIRLSGTELRIRIVEE